METPSQPTIRELRLKKDRLESCIAALNMARALQRAAGLPNTELDSIIQSAVSQRDAVEQRLHGGRLEPRRRPRLPKTSAQRPCFTLFLDECGSHVKPTKKDFPAFCLCCVVVEDGAYANFVPQWEAFKQRMLPRPGGAAGAAIITHEPSLRPGKNLQYRMRTIPNGPVVFERELAAVWSAAPLKVVAVVVDTEAYYQSYGNNPVDHYLPSSIYAMSLDFLMERIVQYLSIEGGGGVGHVIAESREKRLDALIQYEFARLQLEGTQFMADGAFRQHLKPSMSFKTKDDNEAGLQIADLMARPIAERVLNPKAANPRWEALKGKFHDGGHGRPEGYGLKSFPNPVSHDFFA